MTSASTSCWPHTMHDGVRDDALHNLASMVVAAQPPEAAWDHAGLVSIYNYVGDRITVHCKHQLTDLKRRGLPTGPTTPSKCSPTGKKLNHSVYLLFRLGPQHVPRVSCLERDHQLSSRLIHLRSYGFQEVLVQGHPGGHLCRKFREFQSVDRRVPLLNWVFFRNWKIAATSLRSPDSS
jgi:hypothetical protein